MEVPPFQTTEDKLYFCTQAGDEEIGLNKPKQLRLFNGMVGRLFPYEWEVKPCISSYNQGETRWFSVPRTAENDSILREMCTPYTNGLYTGEGAETNIKFRRTKDYFDIDKLANVKEVKEKHPDFKIKFYEHKHRIPLIELKRLPVDGIRDSSEINIDRSPIDEIGQITTGVYTVGPAAGDNYPTYGGVGGFVAAIGANQTGSLTGRNTGPITEVASALTSQNQNNHDFIIESDTPNYGNYLLGHMISVNVAGHCFSLRHSGPGNTYMRNLKGLRILAGGIPNHSFIHDGGVGVSWTGHYCFNLFNGGGLQGGGFYSSDGDPILLIYANMLFAIGNNGILLDAADGNVNSVYENNSIYNCNVGADFTNNAGIIRNNAAIGNTTNYANIGAATVQASPDGLVAAAQWQSLNAADGASFLKPINGSSIAVNGTNPTYATSLIDGILWTSEIGAKSLTLSTGGNLRKKKYLPWGGSWMGWSRRKINRR